MESKTSSKNNSLFINIFNMMLISFPLLGLLLGDIGWATTLNFLDSLQHVKVPAIGRATNAQLNLDKIDRIQHLKKAVEELNQSLEKSERMPAGSSSIFLVTTTQDTGNGSLRKAILDANVNPGIDFIYFNIPGSGVHTITPLSFLPNIVDPVVIDGATQPGFAGQPLIEINCMNIVGTNGLNIFSGNTTIKGLILNRMPTAGGTAIVLFGGTGSVIEGNYVGTDATGTIGIGNSYNGIFIQEPASNNLIGGATAASRNIISANGWPGVFIQGSGAAGNIIQGNFIGTDVTGTAALGNYNVGVGIIDSPANTIENNIISASLKLPGNTYDGFGVVIFNLNAMGNQVVGNLIGVDSTGTVDLGNDADGIRIDNAPGNTIGGTISTMRNIISGNQKVGIAIKASGATGNVIQGNFVGTDKSGLVPIPNEDGVIISDAPNNIIGGSVSLAGNLISGNLQTGVTIKNSGASGNGVQGNYIGVARSDTELITLPNNAAGVFLDDAPDNLVGGILPNEGNYICGNGTFGVSIVGLNATGNRLHGNFIGTDSTLTEILTNGAHGVYIDASQDSVGGQAPGAENFIAYNGEAGVYVASGSGNFIRNNSIFSNAQLGIDLAPTGVNPNDSLDLDQGANDLQNYPLLDSIQIAGNNITIFGRLHSTPNTQFTIEFFANLFSDFSGYGEGKTPLGLTSVMTDNNGLAQFNATVAYDTTSGNAITSTATDPAGNTSEFSRPPTSILITNPVRDELWIAGERDTVKWNIVGGGVDSVDIYFSTGSGFRLIASKQPATPGEYAWDIPDTTLSRKCKILIQDASDVLVYTIGDPFKIKGYELTRIDANGDYERYLPGEDGWNFGNYTSNIWPPSWWQSFDYVNGIDPYTLQKYPFFFSLPPIKAKPKNFPDWSLFVSAFGTNACYWSTSLGIYAPAALTKWTSLKDTTWKGSCYGFAVSSFLAFNHKAQFRQKFQLPNFTDLYSLQLNGFTRSTINELWIYQFGKFISSQEMSPYNLNQKTPVETLNEIKAMFLSETRDDRALILIQFGPNGGGHAVNPYKVVKDTINPNIEWIYVYDNNSPGSTTRRVAVDRALNYWAYAGLFWGGKHGLFLGEPSSTFLNNPMLSQITADDSQINNLNNRTTNIEFYNTAYASILLADQNGNTIGYQDSVVYSNPPIGIPIIPITGYPHQPIGYNLPDGKYSAQMDNFSDTSAAFSVFTDSLVFVYDRSDANINQTDELVYNNNGISVWNPDNQNKTINLETIIIKPSDQKVVDITKSNMSPNDSLRLNVLNRQDIKLVNTGASKTYDLRLRLTSSTKNDLFEHNAISVPSNASHQISPIWNDLVNQPVIIYIDLGNDGTIDDSMTVVNQTNAPDIAVTPPSFDFGNVAICSSDTQAFMVKNQGTADLNVSVLELTGADSTHFSIIGNSAPFTLAPGDSISILVSFDPITDSTKNATLQIQSDDPDENPLLVPLTGNGTGITNYLGDVNEDGTVNSTDALITLSYDAGLPLPQPIQDRINNGFGDVNGDGLTNSTDALLILSNDVGLPVPFPVGKPFCP